MQSSSSCRCVNPNQCSCPKPTNWTTYYNPHYAFINHALQMVQYQQQPILHPSPTRSVPYAQPPYHPNIGHPPPLSAPSRPPQYGYIGPGSQNSIPFPTLATPETVDDPVPLTGAKRKCTTASSSRAPRKKTQQPWASIQSRAQDIGLAITTSTVVGAGPSTPVRTLLLTITAPTPLSSNSNPPTTSNPNPPPTSSPMSNPPSASTNTTYNAILDHLKPTEPGERAIDIWWFIRPWKLDETPVPLPDPEDLTKAVIKVKPQSPFLICWICLCLEKP